MSDRVSFEEGLALFKEAPLEELQEMAQQRRFEKVPQSRVTFVLDSNPNYTNICNADCSFCAFYRHASAKDAYKKSVSEAMVHVERAHNAGLRTVMFQGGLADYPLDFYCNLVRATIEQYPDIYPHYFTAPELWNCAKVNGISIREVLEALFEAGQRSIPGGGAEILSERVRLEVSPKKMEPGGWMEVHRTAHQVGFRSTATMMYGHVEEPEDILIHLDALRETQDEIPGFTAFIPWSYKRDRTALRRKVKENASEDDYMRIISFARIYLDNFDHVQASPGFEGPVDERRRIAMRGLSFGADDLGGITWEENVHDATGWSHSRTSHQDMVEIIREAGYEPAQRNPLYQILRTYDEEEQWPEESQERSPSKLALFTSTL